MALEVDDINLSGVFSATTISATTIVFGGRQIQNVFVQNNTTGGFLPISGGTVTGQTIFIQGLSANTLSGGTILSGSTNLYSIFAQIDSAGGSTTYLQPGLNTYTGGTTTNPTVNVSALTINTLTASGATSLATLSATTIISGSTNLYSIFATTDTNDITRVQPGSNITTGGTSNNPIVNLISSPSINNLTISGLTSSSDGAIFLTLSGGTLFSGSTNVGTLFATPANITSINSQLATKLNDSGDTFTGTLNGIALSATTLSGGTLFSGSTNVGTLFATPANITSINSQLTTKANLSGATFTGNINTSGITATSLSATTLSGSTILSGSTNLYSIFLPLNRARSQSSPSDPATTTSTVGVMMGLAGSITPVSTGNVMVIISGDYDNATGDNGCAVQMRTGTGVAPANAAALTGTARGGLLTMNVTASTGAATNRIPFTCNCLITGLTLNTAIWIDIGLAAVVGGTARARNISISAIEI